MKPKRDQDHTKVYTIQIGTENKGADSENPKKFSKILENESGGHGHSVKHPTSYLETLMHLFKGNVGSGIFAMGDAFKNSGIVLGPILVPILGLICVHSSHLLLNASHYLKRKLNLDKNPDYSTTAELCFATGPERLQKFAPVARTLVNVFLCITQFGFCCVYFVFISSNVQQIMDTNGFVYSLKIHMAVVLIPVLFSSLVRNLKYLAPLSTAANLTMLIGIVITLYYTAQKPFSKVEKFSEIEGLPLFFGTALFSFEGIGLVLPLENEMKNSKQFGKPLGVLNTGMTFVTFLYTLVGLMSYLKYGAGIKGSVTLNLPEDDILAQVVKGLIAFGILCTYPLQFYIPIGIMFPAIKKRFGPLSRPVLIELVFRTVFVLITFGLAVSIPYLESFITLVGAFSSSAVALIFPPILDLVNASSTSRLTPWIIIKNVLILVIGFAGCIAGSIESIKKIIESINKQES
ncbi:hypothetical protein FQR65_LT11783 [Abscondita terminalis]|nr:hypothetical protein FQR65_LT11783 [Abscondita terminalis]